MKEAPYHVLALLGAPKVAAQVVHHLPLGDGAPAPRRVGLNLLIQKLPRVQFWAVGRQVDQPNLGLVALHPPTHLPGDMQLKPLFLPTKSCSVIPRTRPQSPL